MRSISPPAGDNGFLRSTHLRWSCYVTRRLQQACYGRTPEIIGAMPRNPRKSRETTQFTCGEVAQRIADYEKAGVIRGYQAILNEGQAFDLDTVTAVIEVKVTPQREGGVRSHRGTHQQIPRSALRVSDERHA